MAERVIITGASSGIGEELAKKFGARGAAMLLIARRKDKLESVAEQVRSIGGTVQTAICDITQREDFQNILSRFQTEVNGVDIVINNAGRGHIASVEDTSFDRLQSMFALNVYALWHACAIALPAMKKQQSGHIITISSIAGKMGFPFNAAYIAAKHAAVGFHAGLRAELAGTPIRSTVVCPDGVMTEWASATEGGDIGQLFFEGIQRSRGIARDLNIPLPPLDKMKTAEHVAQVVIDAVDNPNADSDIYTHDFSEEKVLLAASNRKALEAKMLPLYLGMREVYENNKQ